MKRTTLAFVCGLGLALAACASAPTVVADLRLTAWTALDAGAVVIDGLAKAHVFNAAMDQTLATDLQTATTDLTDADTAFAQSNFTSSAASVASATALIVAVDNIVAGQNVTSPQITAFHAATAKLKAGVPTQP
jgi:hypothetical protein